MRKGIALTGFLCAALLVLASGPVQSAIPGGRPPIKEPALPELSPAEFNLQVIDYTEALSIEVFRIPAFKFLLLNRLSGLQSVLETPDYSSAMDKITRRIVPKVDKWIANDAVRQELNELLETLGALVLKEMLSTPRMFETIDLGISFYKFGDDYLGVQHYELARTNQEWAAIWSAHVSGYYPQPPVPEIDFSDKMVVMAFLGTYHWSPYSIEVTDVSRVDRYWLVRVERWAPGDPSMPAVTNPCHLVSVDKAPPSNPIIIIDEFTDNVIDIIDVN